MINIRKSSFEYYVIFQFHLDFSKFASSLPEIPNSIDSDSNPGIGAVFEAIIIRKYMISMFECNPERNISMIRKMDSFEEKFNSKF